MEFNSFAQQIETMYERVTKLCQDANTSSVLPVNLLPTAFKELGIASEELQVAHEELLLQNEELALAQVAVEVERQRYQELFENAPDGYLVTNGEGVIRQVNRTAATQLNVLPLHLMGKPLITFIVQEDRRRFRNELFQLSQQDRTKELIISIQPNKGEPFEAALTVTTVRNSSTKPIALRWLLRDITARRQAEKILDKSDYNPSENHPTYLYSKGETIPLKPQHIWQVCKGIVKLNTICETGLEVLVGLAGPSMPFGSNMTSLQIYQATALSDVELVCFSLSEVAANPQLLATLTPYINSRLRQTELLLTISGQRRVVDRLIGLLRLLKQEIGIPVPQGTRLSVRFTHEELASACCSTRVTVTRMLKDLQQQGLIIIDSEYHIILKEEIN